MGNELKKKYGLITAICMVVGIVIGSGVFFKAEKVMNNNNGNMAKSLLTVVIVGAIMIVCAYVFSILAQRHEKVNGIVDYAEVSCGPLYAYGVGWFMTTIYYPTLTSCLAWISAQYTCVLFGWDPATDLHLAIAAFYLVAGYAVNALSPKLAGKFQVSCTFIKLIPLAVMALVGTVAGLINGKTVDAFANPPAILPGVGHQSGGILAAVVAFAFAYEGWIIATSINAELKDSKKNLPRALILGAIIVVAVYLAYFLGLTGALTAEEIMQSGNVPKDAFSALFGSPVFGTIAYVFIIWANDVFAYLVGMTLGRHRLCERLSPKKSWEGFFGGLLGAVAMGLLAARLLGADYLAWAGLALVAAVMGVLGDLAESMFKRAAGVKDSGTLIPGHGGVLDRFDAMLLSAPFVFVYMLFVM